MKWGIMCCTSLRKTSRVKTESPAVQNTSNRAFNWTSQVLIKRKTLDERAKAGNDAQELAKEGDQVISVDLRASTAASPRLQVSKLHDIVQKQQQ
ncbi:hypothetical protein RvY_03830 [Ramazzottius varieornatus]|uniref:Uncharacterized protein n=1 Tax=Ramazzottius varieornatus TaxID=947166 RepID=A0A1D1UT27_RAMVA|nr:hypothetical protein RvY_03830 [Ramazzottius varieornatus]